MTGPILPLCLGVYHARLGCVNLQGHHNGSSLSDHSSAILMQYCPPRDRSNLNHSETLQNSHNLTGRGIQSFFYKQASLYRSEWINSISHFQQLILNRQEPFLLEKIEDLLADYRFFSQVKDLSDKQVPEAVKTAQG